MKIRCAIEEDIEALVCLYLAFFREDGISTAHEVLERNLRLMIGDPRASVFVAEEGKEIVGLASATVTLGVEFGLAAEIEDLYVQPEWRGHGLARRLMDVVLQWSCEKGAKEIILVITPGAEAEQRLTAFYQRFGFMNSGRITMYLESVRDNH
jgi:ribosomal protein S18 acetylase RimI-like enzyme